MKKLSKAEGKRLLWLPISAGFVIALIVTPGLVLMFVTGVLWTGTASALGAFEAPFVIGRIPQTLVILILIWGAVFCLYYFRRPSPQISFKEAEVFIDSERNNQIASKIHIVDTGVAGKIHVYAYGKLELSNKNPTIVRRELLQQVESEPMLGTARYIRSPISRACGSMCPDHSSRRTTSLSFGAREFFSISSPW